MKLGLNDQWSKLFQRGTVIWRRVIYSRNGNIRPDDGRYANRSCDLIRRDGDRWLAKVSLSNNYIYEPVLVPYSVNGEKQNGIVLIMKHQPPPNWTHLLVTGVSKPLQQPGRQLKGGVVFAEAAAPYRMDDYLSFRKRMFDRVQELRKAHGELDDHGHPVDIDDEDELRRQLLNNYAFNDVWDVSDTTWPNEVRNGQFRLVVGGFGLLTDYYCDYAHLEDESVSDDDDELVEEEPRFTNWVKSDDHDNPEDTPEIEEGGGGRGWPPLCRLGGKVETVV